MHQYPEVNGYIKDVGRKWRVRGESNWIYWKDKGHKNIIHFFGRKYRNEHFTNI